MSAADGGQAGAAGPNPKNEPPLDGTMNMNLPTQDVPPDRQGATVDPIDWARKLDAASLPGAVRHQALRCLVDLLGVAAAGSTTAMAGHARALARSQFGAGSGGRGARLFFNGQRVSAAGAAMANAAALDSYDAHDGHALTKGHAGASVLPALLAMAEHIRRPVTGAEFLASLVAGYELAQRAGIALHGSAADYHSSGAWSSLGAAAVGARCLDLSYTLWCEALGIAEYHGPRGPMMRCIDHPAMVKDGATWGAMTGTAAAILAQEGFTGAPAELVRSARFAGLWSDLGQRWTMLEMYFKPYPVCRWAQPAIQATLALRTETGVDASAVDEIVVETFDAAVRLGAALPTCTEQAQYNLGWPLVCALARGRVGADEITPGAWRDERLLALLSKVRLREDPAASRAFPAQRTACVTLRLQDGSVHRRSSEVTLGDPAAPLDDSALIAKARASLEARLEPAAAERLVERALGLLAEPDAVDALSLALDAPAR